MQAIDQKAFLPPYKASQSITPLILRASEAMKQSVSEKEQRGSGLIFHLHVTSLPQATGAGEWCIIGLMEGIILFIVFLVVWFLVLPRIPGVSQFT
jgi:hypothetical protein